MEQEKKGMSKGAKLGLGCLGLIVLFAIIGILAGDSTKNANTDTVAAPAANTDNTSQTPPPTVSAKEKITLSNATTKDKSGFVEVVGEAKNNDTVKHSFTLKATFYDASGKILGTALGAVNDLEPGDTKTYSLFSTDSISSYKEMKVQIDTLVQ